MVYLVQQTREVVEFQQLAEPCDRLSVASATRRLPHDLCDTNGELSAFGCERAARGYCSLMFVQTYEKDGKGPPLCHAKAKDTFPNAQQAAHLIDCQWLPSPRKKL